MHSPSPQFFSTYCFATAGALGWRLKDSIKQSFPSIAFFLIITYSFQLHVVCIIGVSTIDRWLILQERRMEETAITSSAATGDPATAAALAKSNDWKSLLTFTPSASVGDVG